jgi:hypothetical protein
MSGYLSLIVLSLTLTGLFAILVASADLQEITANWKERRCEVPVVIAAGLFKPSYDPRSSTEFARDNFEFCISSLAKEVISIAFAPLYAVMGQQLDATNVMSGPMNTIRGMIAQGMKSFSNVLERQFKQYTAISVQVTKIWHHIKFAMGRIGAIVTSIVYFGLSASMLVQNTMKLIVNVIMIFIGILAAMILLIFFGLLPFIGIIITLIVLLAVADGETGGWISGGSLDAGPFCVDPDAKIVMADESLKSLKDIKIGDKIAGTNNIVTGILRVDASKQKLVAIHNVKMSETHSVFYNNKWMRAQEHPNAVLLDSNLNELICLNTSEHRAIMKGTEEIIVGDWDEASDEDDQEKWIPWASKILNKFEINQFISTTPPLASNTTKVSVLGKGLINISEVVIGDSVIGQRGYTKVTGIYKGNITAETPNNPEWLSDGVWLHGTKGWITAKDGVHSGDLENSLTGSFLITEDETFFIKVNEETILVRDFTEVGGSRLNQCYSWFDDEINKKV